MSIRRFDPFSRRPAESRPQKREPGKPCPASVVATPTPAKTSQANLRRILLGGGGTSRVTRALRQKRTRYVNARKSVVDARIALELLLANTWADAERVRLKMERRLDKGETGAAIADAAWINPAAFGPWFGTQIAAPVRPDPNELAPLLDRLAGALATARAEANRVHPSAPVDTCAPRPGSVRGRR